METLEKGKQKLGEICDLLRKDTLEPAKAEAQKIIDDAHREAERIKTEAHKAAENQLAETAKKIEQERALFNSSLDIAAKQTFDKLREQVEKSMFNQELTQVITKMAHDPEMVGKLVNVLVEVIEREGLHGDLSLGLAKSIKPEELSKYLAKELVEKLKKQELPVEEISGGAVVYIKDQALTVDISDSALKELLGSYLRNSFREILFKNV